VERWFFLVVFILQVGSWWVGVGLLVGVGGWGVGVGGGGGRRALERAGIACWNE
jgi:hypothetical protein